MALDFKSELNARQLEACTSRARHLRIIAGAGTGKTRVLTYRIAFTVGELGIDPRRLVAITFTKKAANELKERARNLLERVGVSGKDMVISTIHSFCNLFLRKEASSLSGFTSRFTVIDDADQKNVINRVAEKLGFGGNDGTDKEKKVYLLSTIGGYKAKGLFPDEVDVAPWNPGAPLGGEALVRGYDMYQRTLRATDCMDFDDLLLYTYRLLKERDDIRRKWANRFDAFLMDEFQDTDPIQYDIVKLLLRQDSLFSVVGDPDQTIYTWRGAESTLITRQLKRDFPDLETVTLDVNYRSTQNILDKANQLITHNRSRLEKSLVASDGTRGDSVQCSFYPSRDFEAAVIASKIIELKSKGYRYSDIAVIYRSNYLSGPIEKKLAQSAIPYSVYGGTKFYERKEIKDALAYFRLIVNPRDNISFERAIEAPRIGLGTAGMEIIAQAAEKDDKGYLEEVRENLSSLHLKKPVSEALSRIVAAVDKAASALEGEDIDGIDASEILSDYLTEVGFIPWVRELDKKEEGNRWTRADDEPRYNNVKELLLEFRNHIDGDEFDLDGNPVKPTLDSFLINIAVQSAQDSIDSADRVLLMTAHISKGLEFPVVFIPGMNDGVFPTGHATERGPAAIEEERRLFYVAITRAKKLLFISSPEGSRFGRGSGDLIPSMFLEEIGFEKAKGSGYLFDSGGSSRGRRRSSSWLDDPEPVSREKQESSDRLLNTKRGHLPSAKPSASSAEASVYRVGDRIAHSSFGVGEIVQVNVNSFVVRFDEPYGEKTLSKAYTKAFRKI